MIINYALKSVIFRMKEINQKFQNLSHVQSPVRYSFYEKYMAQIRKSASKNYSKKLEIPLQSQKINDSFKFGIRSGSKMISAKNKSISEIIRQASFKHNVPENLIWSIIKAESAFNPRAVSPAGAKGLMQLMPKTAQYLGVKNIYDPEENIMAGVKYMKQLMNRFHGDLKLSLAAYNAGPSRVSKENKVPNIKQTHSYIRKVLDTCNRLNIMGV